MVCFHLVSRYFEDTDRPTAAIATWPSAPLLFDTIEGPLFSKLTLQVLYMAYMVFPVIWTMSFIVTMVIAEKVHVGRLPIFYCYLGRIPFGFAELVWYKGIFERMEREAWSLNTASNRPAFSDYAMINKYPSLLFGFKRGACILCAAIIFLCLGTINNHRSWARWCGTIVLLEFIYRTFSYLGWSLLPRIPAVRSYLERANKILSMKFLSGIKRRTKDVRIRHERVPFREEEVEPFETWSKVWSSYANLYRSLAFSLLSLLAFLYRELTFKLKAVVQKLVRFVYSSFKLSLII